MFQSRLPLSPLSPLLMLPPRGSISGGGVGRRRFYCRAVVAIAVVVGVGVVVIVVVVVGVEAAAAAAAARTARTTATRTLVGEETPDFRHHLNAATRSSTTMTTMTTMTTRTTLLLGIFSTLRPPDARRRALIRETYLSSDGRFCPLKTYLQQQQQQQQQRRRQTGGDGNGNGNGNGDGDESGSGNYEECTVPYAFVVGGNTSGPEDHDDYRYRDGAGRSQAHVDGPPPPVALDRGLGGARENDVNDDDDDVVYLNIKENMQNGKTPTWFKYATSIVLSPHSSLSYTSSRDVLAVVEFDYVAKIDSDTFVHPSVFLDDFLPSLLPAPYNARTYGPVDRWRPDPPPRSEMKRFGNVNLDAWTDGDAGGARTARHGPGAGEGVQRQGGTGGQFYAPGQFYVLSYDLAKYVSKLGSRRRYDIRRERWSGRSISSSTPSIYEGKGDDTNHSGDGNKPVEDVDVALWVQSSDRPIKWLMYTPNSDKCYSNSEVVGEDDTVTIEGGGITQRRGGEGRRSDGNGKGGGGGGGAWTHPVKDDDEWMELWEKEKEKEKITFITTTPIKDEEGEAVVVEDASIPPHGNERRENCSTVSGKRKRYGFCDFWETIGIIR